jgi:hypothetical protein
MQTLYKDGRSYFFLPGTYDRLLRKPCQRLCLLLHLRDSHGNARNADRSVEHIPVSPPPGGPKT